MNLRLHPHPSRFACHLPPLGGRLEHWQSLDCTVVSVDAPISLPPHGGRWLAEGQTDEGEAEGLLYVTNQRYNRKEEGP